jgi:hypothetical protein
MSRLVVWVLAGAIAACGGSAGPGDSTAAAGSVRPPGLALTPHADLANRLPAVTGWQRGGVSSGPVAMPAAGTHAATSYTQGDARVDLEITDSGGAPEYLSELAKIAGTAFEQKAGNGYIKGTSVADSPAVESWNHVDRLGDVSVIVAGRFIVHGASRGTTDVGPLRAIVSAAAGAMVR